jgi:hypothetical protein
MRHLTKLLLTAGLAVAFVSIVLAQRPPMGGGGFQTSEGQLLMSKSVQDELKLTDAQKEKVKKIADDLTAAMKKARDDMDFTGIAKIRETAEASSSEVVKDLKPEQRKRLMQIYVQQVTNGKNANVAVVFKNEDVQTELKLTDKQKTMIKTLLEDADKDTKEIRKGLTKDSTQDDRKAANEKISTLNKEVLEKIQASLTDDQKKAWKDLPGDKFEGKIDNPFGGGGRPGKDKKKDTE